MKIIDAEPGLAARVERWLIADSQELTESQRKSLGKELTSPKYGGLTDAECLEVLRTPTTTMESVRRDADWTTTKRWLKQYSDGLLFGVIKVSATIKSKWLLIIPNLSYESDYSYNPEDPKGVFLALATDAVKDGIIKPEDVDKFCASWYHESESVVPSPLDAMVSDGGDPLFTANCVLELSDIAGVRG